MIAIEELRRLAGLGTSTVHDSHLLELESAAVAHVERYTGRYWSGDGQTTERVIGNGTPYLYLSEKADTLPTTVSEYSQPGASAVTITAANDDGYEDWGGTVSKLARKNGVWTRGFIYSVTYTRGYEEGEEPADIRWAVGQLVVWWFERRLPVPDKGESVAELPHHIKTVLRTRRKLRVR